MEIKLLHYIGLDLTAIWKYLYLPISSVPLSLYNANENNILNK